ncbi:hypothetical protein TRIUR3_28953 [Triticum urartu]|uniref:Uncharacterized protein n=1 Tax=Triticum urartu TaxID=4572 RepID=M7ZEW6_TRIUA|nr:hypothetical protein TRIUR3_28953 [Triticum urartu]
MERRGQDDYERCTIGIRQFVVWQVQMAKAVIQTAGFAGKANVCPGTAKSSTDNKSPVSYSDGDGLCRRPKSIDKGPKTMSSGEDKNSPSRAAAGPIRSGGGGGRRQGYGSGETSGKRQSSVPVPIGRRMTAAGLRESGKRRRSTPGGSGRDRILQIKDARRHRVTVSAAEGEERPGVRMSTPPMLPTVLLDRLLNSLLGLGIFTISSSVALSLFLSACLLCACVRMDDRSLDG